KGVVALHRLDLVKQLDELGVVEVDQTAVAEAQVTARQRGQRIAEGAAFESHGFQKVRELVVIFNQPAGGDAGRGLDANGMEKFVRLLDLFADIGQAAVFFVLGNVVRINGHDDAGQTVTGQAPHVFLVPQAAVGAD